MEYWRDWASEESNVIDPHVAERIATFFAALARHKKPGSFDDEMPPELVERLLKK
jgi:hypothetical protein